MKKEEAKKPFETLEKKSETFGGQWGRNVGENPVEPGRVQGGFKNQNF